MKFERRNEKGYASTIYNNAQAAKQPWLFCGLSIVICQERLFFDWSPNEAAPFGPGAVVVAYLRITQQIVQHKPGVAAALSNATIGDNFLIRRNTFATIDCAQFVSRLEGAIF